MTPDFYACNRAALMKELDGALVILTAFTSLQGAADSAAVFEQEANFLWLSGINAPDWWLIIDGASEKSWLVSPGVSDNRLLFDGSLTHEEALRMSGADKVLEQDEASRLLARLAKSHESAYTIGEPRYSKSADFVLNPAPRKLRNLLKRTFTSVQDCQKQLARLRAIKQPAEVELMMRAATLTVGGFQALTDSLATFRHEYEAEAELSYYFRRHGAVHAFEPIVAGGKNACTLHYVQNSASINSPQLLLVDAGARIDGYPADVTRTFAVGESTERQKEVHKAVQVAERQIIELLRPGLRLKDYVETTDNIMKEALLSVGLLENLEDGDSYRHYFPHAVSHGLGLEVHESLGGYEEFQPGMVLTVEPGIYVPEESIGVRIEDDILITDRGHVNLTGSLSTDY